MQVRCSPGKITLDFHGVAAGNHLGYPVGNGTPLPRQRASTGQVGDGPLGVEISYQEWSHFLYVGGGTGQTLTQTLVGFPGESRQPSTVSGLPDQSDETDEVVRRPTQHLHVLCSTNIRLP